MPYLRGDKRWTGKCGSPGEAAPPRLTGARFGAASLHDDTTPVSLLAYGAGVNTLSKESLAGMLVFPMNRR